MSDSRQQVKHAKLDSNLPRAWERNQTQFLAPAEGRRALFRWTVALIELETWSEHSDAGVDASESNQAPWEGAPIWMKRLVWQHRLPSVLVSDPKHTRDYRERFVTGQNRTKRAHFRGSPLFQATNNIKTEKQTINSVSYTHLTLPTSPWV